MFYRILVVFFSVKHQHESAIVHLSLKYHFITTNLPCSITSNLEKYTNACFHPRKFGWFKQKTNPRWIQKIIAKNWATERTNNLCFKFRIQLLHVCSLAQSCLTLCNPINCSTPGSPVLHYLLESAQVHVHWASENIM